MERIYDVAILGGGPAGYTAALYAARAGLDTLIIEKISIGGQMTLTGNIDNYPGFPDGVDGFELGMKMQQGAEKYGAETVFAEILSAELEGKIKSIATSDGSYNAKTVIIATGANPRRLGLPEEDALTGRGIHYCAHCDGHFYKGKTVAVIGGGNSAAQDALYLGNVAQKVYLIHRRDTLRATKIYHEPLMRAENIEFVPDSVAIEVIIGKGIKISNVKSNEHKVIECDGIFVSIGREPATELFRDTVKLDDNGYIVADESTKTNLSGVFAAGDVRTKALRQVVTAVSDGAAAAHMAEEYLHSIIE